MKPFLKIIVCLIGVCLVGQRYVFLVRVRGTSMHPTIADGELLLFRRHPATVREGQIIAMKLSDTRSVLIKRVIAGPGAAMSCGRDARGHRAFSTALIYPEHRSVPPGHAFIQGDSDGIDSRQFGPIPYTIIVGVLISKLNIHEKN